MKVPDLRHGLLAPLTKNAAKALPPVQGRTGATGLIELPPELDAAVAECLDSDDPFCLDTHSAAEQKCCVMIRSDCDHHVVLLSNNWSYQETTKMIIEEQCR